MPTYARNTYSPIFKTRPSLSPGIVASIELACHLHTHALRSNLHVQDFGALCGDNTLDVLLRIRLHQEETAAAAAGSASLGRPAASPLGVCDESVDELSADAGSILAAVRPFLLNQPCGVVPVGFRKGRTERVRYLGNSPEVPVDRFIT